MDNRPHDVYMQESRDVCAAADNATPSSVTEVSCETIPSSDHASVTADISSESCLNNNSLDCQKCARSEFDGNDADFPSVTSQLGAGCDERLQLFAGKASSTDALANTTTECSDHEIQLCAPIVTVGGTNEEELKRGLEQRLGLVLTKLAREHDEDIQNVDERGQIISDDTYTEQNVDEALSVDTDVESTDASDVCQDIHHILTMDIVQEMDEVERYSYASLVAYAMHQLFEYSTWNQ